MKTFTEFCKTKLDLHNPELFDSKTLFAEMALLNPNAINKLQLALQFIRTHNIPGVIIGGIAVSHWTKDRKLTPDVDYLTPDLSQVQQICNKQGLTVQPLASEGTFGGIHIPEYDADFLDATQGNTSMNNYVLRTAVMANIGGIQFRIVDPAVLAIMKFTIGRNKDTEDAFNLLPIIDKPSLKNHLTMLKNNLGSDIDAKTIWNYAKAF